MTKLNGLQNQVLDQVFLHEKTIEAIGRVWESYGAKEYDDKISLLTQIKEMAEKAMVEAEKDNNFWGNVLADIKTGSDYYVQDVVLGINLLQKDYTNEDINKVSMIMKEFEVNENEVTNNEAE